MAGSSFCGLLTPVEIGHMRIGSPGKGHMSSLVLHELVLRDLKLVYFSAAINDSRRLTICYLRFKIRIRIDPHQYAQRVHACQPSDHLVQINLTSGTIGERLNGE